MGNQKLMSTFQNIAIISILKINDLRVGSIYFKILIKKLRINFRE